MAEEKQQPEDLFEVLQQACDRNVPLELHYFNPNQAPDSIEPEVLRAQTRLLSLEGDSILVDFPQDIGRTLRMRTGFQARAYFSVGETIYHFPTTVTELRYRVDLNQVQSIIGCRLARPERIITAQRREDHRISVAVQESIIVQMHESGKDDLSAVPVKARRGSGRVVNMSRGGLAVRIEGDARLKFRVGQYCFCTFTLPGNNVTVVMLGEFRHAREILGRDACVMGVQFLKWPNATEYRNRIGAIGRYVVDLERAQIRAKNGHAKAA